MNTAEVIALCELAVNIVIGVATVISLFALTKQVKGEIAANKLSEQADATARQELLNDQIRMLCISWCSAREKDIEKETLHSAGAEESQGVRISNYSNTVFRDFKLTAWYEKEEEIRVTKGIGAFYVKRKDGTFEATKDKAIATHRQGVNGNIYSLKIEAATPYLRPGDYYVCAKQGVVTKTGEKRLESISTTGFSCNPEFLDVEQLSECGLTLSTLGIVNSGMPNDDHISIYRPRRFKFKASCLDIRGNRWEISSDNPEWTQQSREGVE